MFGPSVLSQLLVQPELAAAGTKVSMFPGSW